jgi:UDP-N-acetylmuramate--alanine ligase
MPKLSPEQHIHLVGIGGAGLSAIARILLGKGFTVSGSDRSTNAQTDTLAQDGATIYAGHDARYVNDADALIISSAVAADHVEVARARERGIPVYKRSDIIDAITAGQDVIAVSGTHGKTTTTAMTTHILLLTERDPSYIIGGVLRSSGQNAAYGHGPAFVIEADEYDNMFHGLRPRVAIINNVEWDHPDFFPTPDVFTASFVRFSQLIPSDGLLIACADDAGAAAIATARRSRGGQTVTFGIDASADWQATGILVDAETTRFNVLHQGEQVAEFELQVPGRHNVLNAMAATAAAYSQGVTPQEAAQALMSFGGAGRRFDVRADIDGLAIIDDYAHHPTAIRVMLDAARSRYPNRALWAVWQPHTYSRTQQLAQDYLQAFGAADHVIVTDIYAAREQPVEGVNSAALVAAMPHPDARHAATLDEAAAMLDRDVQIPAVVLIMSAGDAPKIGIDLLQRRGLTA